MLNWPAYDTKRNKRSIALTKKQLRHMALTAREHGTQRNAHGYVMPNGVWYSPHCRLSALVDPAECPTRENRGEYWRIVRRHRLSPTFLPHPVLP